LCRPGTSATIEGVLRADLHVHTWHSGYNHDLPFLKSRDCYAYPLAVYQAAKRRGMDLVAITDHDSIDGGLELLSRLPDGRDVILGEEVSCWLPVPGASGSNARVEVHFGTWGMTETAHREIQPLRGNAVDVAGYLRGAGIFFAFNHPFHFYRGQLPLARYLELADLAPAIETRNGAMLPAHNQLATALATSRGRVVVGGSDAHTLRRVGTTWTAAPGATREEFLASVAAGRGRVGGVHGSTLQLAGDIYGVIGQYWLSLIGLRRHEISVPRRLLGGTFSLVTLPGEFVPLVVAARSKQKEARWVASSATGLGVVTGAAVRPPAEIEPEPGL
jgi:predicted metal-dependent phosphoesterase TrpH